MNNVLAEINQKNPEDFLYVAENQWTEKDLMDDIFTYILCGYKPKGFTVNEENRKPILEYIQKHALALNLY